MQIDQPVHHNLKIPLVNKVQKLYGTEKRSQLFQESWKVNKREQKEWLAYDSSKQIMLCSICALWTWSSLSLEAHLSVKGISLT